MASHRHPQRRHCQCLIIQILLSLSSITTSSTAKVPALIVFGDSTVDAGNNNYINTILRSNFRPYGRDFLGGRPTGRFGNGRLASDFVSEGLGLGPTVPAYLDPSYNISDFATGVCFASAGTGLDNATADVLSVIPLWKEVEYFKQYLRQLRGYLGRERARETVSEAVYLVSIGTNDFLENYFLLVTGRYIQFSVGGYEDFLIGLAADFFTEIYRLGARKIAFAGLSPMGCLPLERTANFLQGGACNEEYNRVAREFNVKVQAMAGELCAALPGLRLRYTNTYDPMFRMISNPSLYGFENVEKGCCGTGLFETGYTCDQWSPFTCPDADKYFWWDAFHPTEKVNRIMAQFVLNGTLAEFL